MNSTASGASRSSRTEAPELKFGDAPIPVDDASPTSTAPATSPATSSASPRRAENPEAAWELVKYLTTDTEAIVKLANEHQEHADHDGALHRRT